MFSAMAVKNIELVYQAFTSWDAKEIDIYLKDKL